MPTRLTPLFGTTTVTTSYAATTGVAIPGADAKRPITDLRVVDLYITYVVADSNNVEIRPEFQINGGGWFSSHSYSWSSGTLSYYPEVIKLTASSYDTTGYAVIWGFYIPKDADKIRFQIRKTTGTGTVTLSCQGNFYDQTYTNTV